LVAGHRIDDCVANDLVSRAVLVIAHNADFDRRFLERRLPAFTTKHWACSRFDVAWKAAGIRSSALEFVAYCLASSTTGIGLQAIVEQTPCAGATAPRHGAARVAGPLGTSEIADVALMGGGRRH